MDTQLANVDVPIPNSRAAAAIDFFCSTTYATAFSRYSTENDLRRCAMTTTLPGEHAPPIQGVTTEPGEVQYAAQGRTVDTAHSVLTERSGRDGLYVGLTRGRQGNWAYVVCERNPGPDEERVAGDPVATLARVLANDEPALAATQVLSD